MLIFNYGIKKKIRGYKTLIRLFTKRIEDKTSNNNNNDNNNDNNNTNNNSNKNELIINKNKNTLPSRTQSKRGYQKIHATTLLTKVLIDNQNNNSNSNSKPVR